MRSVRRTAWVAALAVVAGCAGGPEVRVAPDDSSWKPSRLVLLPPVFTTTTMSAGKSLPPDVDNPTVTEAMRDVEAALVAGLRARAALDEIGPTPAFTRSATGAAAEKLARQYVETRACDPGLAAALREELAADAVLVTAVLKYGPEMDSDVARVSQNATAKVGQSDLAVSAAGSSALVYYRAQFRCALIRLSDGAIVWDAGVREHAKRGAFLNVTQVSTLRKAVGSLLNAFPYLKEGPAGEQPPAP